MAKNTKKNYQKKNEELDIWSVLKERKRKGLTDVEIEVIPLKEPQSLSKGKHNFIIDDLRRGSVICTSCKVSHGGILEAHLLHRYKVENGIIYLDGEPTNESAN